MNIRTVQPAYQVKQAKRKQMAAPSDSDSTPDSTPDLGAAKPPPKKKKKNQKSRSIKTIDEDLHAILDVAFNFLKMDLTHFLPWPRVGVPSGPASKDNNEIDTLLLKAFDAACEERGIDDVVECPEAALQLMRSRIPQFRAGLKELAQQRVVDTFDFVDLQKLEDPTPERIAECIAKNRERVVTLEKSFHYQDPYNTNIPNTMYRNKIIPALFGGYWFGPRGNNRAYYFRGLTRVSFITIALIMSAILCAIREWSTGRWVLVKFEAREFLQPYNEMLGRLEKWEAFSHKEAAEKNCRNLALELQEELLRNARATAAVPVEEEEEDVEQSRGDADDTELLAMFAANQEPAMSQ
ncbi:hypothetical protein C8J57DRAFT_1714495 [Mycena rebaudengoi]|nr:hypothetical protein C8J57DRAFT_1714495 [Mycena rebaudengoi]